ncbi:MAG TPA: ATP-binding protein, partial [Vicinamibacteria bacterium]|nr:ATP-binding protein [Vicinamibacteria bacterium]
RERRAAPRRPPRPPARPSLVLLVPSQTDFLALVRDVTRRMAETAGFDGTEAERVALAVDEATTNVLEHAYGGATDRTVEIRFEDRGPALCIDVMDNGARVDPKAVPRVDLERYVSERRTGGLGVHLMEKIMDSVTFRRSARRNVCCLVKRKAGSAGS